MPSQRALFIVNTIHASGQPIGSVSNQIVTFHVFSFKICSFGNYFLKFTLKLTLAKDRSFAPT